MAEELRTVASDRAKRLKNRNGREEEEEVEEDGKRDENGHQTKRVKASLEDVEDGTKRFPKRKIVLLIVYSGKGYHGMQVSSWGRKMDA